MFPLALTGALAVTLGALVRESSADLEGQTFVSRPDHVRMIVPRGWRTSDQVSYPGLILWMARSQPQGQMVLTSERFTHELYCSWPVACRTSRDPLPARYACALRQKLTASGLRIEAVQPGPKENENVGLDSVWFEYQDSKHFMRHAIAFANDRVYSLILTAPNSEARATHTRAFEQALRTMQPLSEEEVAAAAAATAPTAPDDATPSDGAALPGDGSAANLADASIIDAGASFESAPAPKVDLKVDPVSACK